MNSVSIKTYRISDLKRIYRVLHQHILEQTDLMDSEIFEDLQAYLQGAATLSGIDISHHDAWEAWLKDEIDPMVTFGPPRRHLRLVKN
jgi:hypothetical protein